MRGRFSAVVAATLLFAASAGPLCAQTAAAHDRFRISLNAGVQPSSTSFGTSIVQPLLLENETIDAAYKVNRAPWFDGGVAVTTTSGFGVGVAVSMLSKRSDVPVTAAIPHPFFFHTPRAISGTASGLTRDELATHLQVVYVIRPGGRLDVALAAGPSFFRITQGFVSGVSYSDTYPYDTATFASASSQQLTTNETGFNAGADVGVRLARHVGVGGLVRVSKATASFIPPASTTTVKIRAGGTQVAGGVRVYF